MEGKLFTIRKPKFMAFKRLKYLLLMHLFRFLRRYGLCEAAYAHSKKKYDCMELCRTHTRTVTILNLPPSSPGA